MFKNKTVVVTGAGGTLCSAIAIELASLGANVVLVGRTKEKLDVVYEKIQAAGVRRSYILATSRTKRV